MLIRDVCYLAGRAGAEDAEDPAQLAILPHQPEQVASIHPGQPVLKHDQDGAQPLKDVKLQSGSSGLPSNALPFRRRPGRAGHMRDCLPVPAPAAGNIGRWVGSQGDNGGSILGRAVWAHGPSP
jgi:hypothetical protein